MTGRTKWLVWIAVLLAACSGRTAEEPDFGIDAGDSRIVCTDHGDDDGDGIPNGVEGCASDEDTDGDKLPDWQDPDSDNDGIPDDIEKGERDGAGNCKHTKPPDNNWPCDTDGDGIPDYRDVDSDGDGLLDSDEDTNGDGLVGCCLTTCSQPGSPQQAGCSLTQDGCGDGQQCEFGKCLPSLNPECAGGEIDPRKIDTFGDGCLDSAPCTPICGEIFGSRPIQLRKNVQGDWHIALDKTAKYNDRPRVAG